MDHKMSGSDSRECLVEIQRFGLLKYDTMVADRYIDQIVVDAATVVPLVRVLWPTVVVRSSYLRLHQLLRILVAVNSGSRNHRFQNDSPKKKLIVLDMV